MYGANGHSIGPYSYICTYLHVSCFKADIFVTTLEVKKLNFASHLEAAPVLIPLTAPSRGN